MLVKVEDSKFVRDTTSMALINKDMSAKEDYLNRVRQAKLQREEINTIRTEMDSVKSDVQDIKKMLEQLLGKGTNG